ncbi:transcriptional regulator, MucR family [Rhodoblastus acidophilus]|uniref:Transcriptional regulator, MucR family n=1 Tax=Rhodoblastus acidophilus TaxID=1074 RepID=A0A212SG47_RHOAC|nr:MucR family transcriptional regulator [Rhodoblastus acidophilus]PPQ34807.1 MucR family transcriptional regulator [Rhodoblastus acidophilus]RAI16509.1 MucR family transcriptional regulator [Rhodoblastus acidophilus]SNB84679.1 transcriptional regulator, MucR family [Rhodoblastus acidophilus]
MAENDNMALVAQILSSYLANNTVVPADLTSVIETVKTAFGLATETATPAAIEEPKRIEPAVPVKKSINPDALTCLCCGKPFKALKRHLDAEHNLSPDEYRATFGLKADYPIVAPNYSAQRSSLAKSAGLGRKAGEPAKKAVGKKPPRRKTADKAAAE